MRRYIVHILALLHLPILFLLGIALNSGILGAYLGASLSAATDPLLIVIAVVVGLLSTRPLYLVAGSAAGALIVSVIVPYVNTFAVFEMLTLLARFSAILTIAAVLGLTLASFWRERPSA
jgi:hypothetical protein